MRPPAERNDQIKISCKGYAAQIIIEMAAQQIAQKRHCNLILNLLIDGIQHKRGAEKQQIPPLRLTQPQIAKITSATRTAPTTPQKPKPFPFINKIPPLALVFLLLYGQARILSIAEVPSHIADIVVKNAAFHTKKSAAFLSLARFSLKARPGRPFAH